MSQETLNTILSGIAAFTGFLAVSIAIHQILQHRKEREEDRRTAEEQRQRAEEQLSLARQQAELRPDFQVSMHLKPYGSGSPELGTLVVGVHNSGKVAANSVSGWIYFEAAKLSPYDPWAASLRSGRPRLPPYVHNQGKWGSTCEEDQLPKNGFYQGYLWKENGLLPGTRQMFEFHVRKLRQGEAEVRYRVVSSEGARITGSATVEVTTGEGEEP
jgi:hypothetical protein